MAAPQQFSLRWNNYSQHIVTALDDLRSDDELTDVTLSCDGQRLKAHKILLAACSSFFRDTFKENPCKHPIIIIKGVSFRDLEAVVTFMYNGQVNVSQDRLQTFLAAAELLQIKGLTDVNDKEETSKKRASTQPPVNSSQNHNNSLSHSSRSGTPDLVQRPPSPKRKRAGGDVGNDSVSSVGAFSGVNNSGASLGGTLVGSNGGAHSGLNAEPNDSFQPKVAIKYEDEQEEEDFDDKGNMSSEDNDNSIQDLMCNVEPGTLGSFLSGSGGAGIGTSGTDSSHDSGSGFIIPEELELEEDSDDYLLENQDSSRESLQPSSGPDIKPPLSPSSYPPKLLPAIFDSHLSLPPLRHQRSILKINPQHGTPAEPLPVPPPKLQSASKRPLPKLVKARPIPQLNTVQALDGNILVQPLPYHVQVPCFSLTRQFLEGDPPSPKEEIEESPKSKRKKKREAMGALSPSGTTIPYPHRINKNNNISTSNLNDPGDPNSPFICPLCSKAYVHLRSLKDHMKAHRGLTRCPACGKSFSKVANMRAHFAVQHATRSEEDGFDYLAEFGLGDG